MNINHSGVESPTDYKRPSISAGQTRPIDYHSGKGLIFPQPAAYHRSKSLWVFSMRRRIVPLSNSQRETATLVERLGEIVSGKGDQAALPPCQGKGVVIKIIKLKNTYPIYKPSSMHVSSYMPSLGRLSFRKD